jgi:hypothetical protein
MDQVISRVIETEKEYDQFTGTPQIWYNLKHWEPLMLSLLTSPALATYLKEQLLTHKLVDRNSVFVVLQIARLTLDEALWLRTAEDFAEAEQSIMLQLLDTYQAQDSRTSFLRTARKAMEIYPSLFNEYIFAHVSPEEDKQLYLQALDSLTRQKRSVEHYRLLQPYLSQQQRDAFIESFWNSYDSLFYVKLLEVEYRFTDIMKVLKQTSIWQGRDYAAILAPVASHFPNECMDLVMDRSTTVLESDRKNRHSYQDITSWLKVLHTVPALQEQVRLFSQHLYDTYSRLRALREELQYAGVLRRR